MPVRVSKISVDFDPYTETGNVVTRKCYRCKQIKTLIVSSVAITLVSIIIMLHTLRLVLNAWISLSNNSDPVNLKSIIF